MTRGIFTYDFGDCAGMTPMMPMHTLGHNFVPQPIHAGGLRYHGVSPLISQTINEKLVSPMAIPQLECYRGAIQWARTEGGIIAPESSHAVAATIREALKAKEEGKEKVILMNLSGHGHMDLLGYQKYLAGDLKDYELPQAEIDKAEAELANLPKAAI
jgi:tryptophan synthase beta chain